VRGYLLRQVGLSVLARVRGYLLRQVGLSVLARPDAALLKCCPLMPLLLSPTVLGSQRAELLRRILYCQSFPESYPRPSAHHSQSGILLTWG